MLYLLDANTLIDAKRDYYPIERVPEFWEWLKHHGNAATLKIPIEVYEEFSDTADASGNKDALATWAELPGTKESLLLDEEASMESVSKVIYTGYMEDLTKMNPLTDDELDRMGRDPFLISYALADTANRCVVTTEVSKPGRKGAAKHVPDVCSKLGVRCINTFGLLSELNFSTDPSKW